MSKSHHHEPEIPREIIEAEARMKLKAAHPSPAREPRMFAGLPELPANIIEVIVRYLHWVAVFIAADSVWSLLPAVAPGSTIYQGPAGWLSLALTAAAAVSAYFAFRWLPRGREAGWTALAVAFICWFGGRLVLTGGGSILFDGVQVLLVAWVMWQVRDHFTAP